MSKVATLEEIEALPRNTLRPADVAPYLNACRQTINVAARDGLLPWAYKLGSRTVIPKGKRQTLPDIDTPIFTMI